MIAAGKLYPDAVLVFPGAQEKNLRNFFLHSASYVFNVAKAKQIALNRVKRLILVDTRQKSRIGKFAELAGKQGLDIHIYDHHPDSQDDIRGTYELIEKAGSTTAILTRLIREREIPLSPDEATIMCLGIHEDTGSFTFSSTTPLDYEAAAWLSRQGANHNVISDMLTREMTAEQIWLLNDLTRSAVTRVFNGIEVVITKVIRDEYIGDFAVLVHKFMEMDNLNVVFALAQMEDRIYLVARSRLPEVNAADIAIALGGGGHPQAASATVRNKTLAQAERSLQALLRNRIKPTKHVRDIMTQPVIQVSPDETMEHAAALMTRYNINVLIVMDEQAALKGYITRQIVEKAVYLGLRDPKVHEYMNIEFFTIGPDAPLSEAQDLIVRKRIRVLPVVDGAEVMGVITRTDILNILMGEPLIPEPGHATGNTGHMPRKKSIAGMLKERLPRNIIHRLKDIGHVADTLGYNAHLVGGLVRDIFLKRENLDVDIVIEGDGIHFAQEFAARHDARVRSHKKFGTAVLVFPDGFKVDVATARVEYYESPGAPPIVESSSLKLDLYRRDFTINTLAIKLNQRHYGTLIDYFGAQQDIKDKVLRVLHNLSFVEDPTRILRAIRFEQRFGFKIGKLTRALILNAVKINCLNDVSGRRLFTELKLLLKEQDPVKAIEGMDEFGLLPLFSPGITLTDRLKELLEEIERVIAWYDLLYLEGHFEPWKVHFHGLTSSLDTKALEALGQRLGMTDLDSRKMLSQRRGLRDFMDGLYRFKGSNYQLYTILSPYDTETLLYVMALSNNENMKRLISSYFMHVKGAEILVTGKDLVAMGFQPGPLFKEIFERLLEARLNDRVKTKQDEIRIVEELRSSII
ncbi:MAG: CBS domain-containing protein [Deltaproteobacteria bacterium]|nr:CBS domain-containing protein [Deltaproteobacteria bacterium]